MKRSSKKIIALVILVSAAATTLFGWEVYHEKKAVAVVVPKQVAQDRAIVIDTAKLRLMEDVYDRLNFNRDEFLLVGKLSASNGADSTDRLDPSTYVFSKKGSSFYFKLGNTETINQAGLYLYIDHVQKKIMLGAEKRVVPNADGLPKLKDVLKRMKEEGYALKNSVEGDTEMIALSNPYHVSCKEYAVYFDPVSHMPKRLSLRLSDFSAPEDSKGDKLIDLEIKQVSINSGLEKYTGKQPVKKEGERWVTGDGYEGYELIVL